MVDTQQQNGMTDEQIRRANEKYRSEEPSPLHTQAYRTVLRGGDIPEDEIQKMVDRLYEPFSDRLKNHPVDPFETKLPTKETGNGLGKAVSKNTRSINLHISQNLFQQQPIGVLLRPINDAVRKRREALITRFSPRSDTVEEDVMPAEHVKLEIEPFPVWLAKWVGENGYPEQ